MTARPSKARRRGSVHDTRDAAASPSRRGPAPVDRSGKGTLARCGRAGAALWDALYRTGRPVQYSYLERPLAVWDVQTAFAGRPWAVEPPSAGLPLTWDLLARLRGRGVRLARITHGAGLSSTGDPA